MFGREGKFLEERMIAAADNRTRIEIVSRFLEDRVRSNDRELPPLYRSIGKVLHADGDIKIADLASEHGLSLRQFERKFKEFAGINPKLYSRVVRFQAATRHKLEGIRDLTEIAYASGYYDQSHFIKDFRQFSGYTPKEYFWNEAEGTQYMNS